MNALSEQQGYVFRDRHPERDEIYALLDELSAEARLWNPWNNRQMVIFALVGIDPEGGLEPLSSSVAWSSPVHERESWVVLRTSATAESDWITVYLRGYSQYSRLMNTRFRHVRLADVIR